VVEGVDVGTRGTEYFDDFNSWRSQAWAVGETVSRAITYDYDPLFRLTSASSSDGDLFQYTYDAAGNRLTETTTGGVTLNYTYDNANRLSSVEGVSYSWDNNGNLLSDGVGTYTYNHANQLTGVSQGGTNYSYAYNGLGDRLRQTVGANTTNYVIDNSIGLSQVLVDKQDYRKQLQ
jgi:YD repeat-containing protein